MTRSKTQRAEASSPIRPMFRENTTFRHSPNARTGAINVTGVCGSPAEHSKQTDSGTHFFSGRSLSGLGHLSNDMEGHSSASQHTNETEVGENSASEKEVKDTPLCGEERNSGGFKSCEFFIFFPLILLHSCAIHSNCNVH